MKQRYYTDYIDPMKEKRMSWKELMVSASMAGGQLAAKERDRLIEKRHRDGRPKAFAEKTKERIEAVVGEGAARVVVSQTAHLAAKEISKRVGQETVKKIAKEFRDASGVRRGTSWKSSNIKHFSFTKA